MNIFRILKIGIMTIRVRRYKYNEDDMIACSRLTRNTYKAFCFDYENKEASIRYMDMYDTDKDIDFTRKIMNMSKIFFVACDGGQIVGLVRGGIDRIRGLYVDKDRQGEGIGRKLVEVFEKEVMKHGAKVIKIRASLYSVNFYKKRGYKKSTGLRLMGGSIVQPMKKVIG